MNKKIRILFVTFVAIILLLTAVSYGQNDPNTISRFTEVKLGLMPSQVFVVVRSPDQRHIAFVTIKGVKELVGSVARSTAGVDFQALDRQPVHVFFLLVSPPDKPAEHLKAMENIFRSAQKEHWRRFLKQAESVDSIWELMVEADEEAIV